MEWQWVCYTSHYFVHVYVCVYVCMHVCMYVMYVCMYVRWCAHVRARRRVVGGGGEGGITTFETRCLAPYLYYVEHGHNCDLTIVYKKCLPIKKPLNRIEIFWYQFTPRKLLYHMVSVNLVKFGPQWAVLFWRGPPCISPSWDISFYIACQCDLLPNGGSVTIVDVHGWSMVEGA